MPQLVESVNNIVSVFYKHAHRHGDSYTLNRNEMKWLIMEEFTEVIKVRRSQHGQWVAKGWGEPRNMKFCGPPRDRDKLCKIYFILDTIGYCTGYWILLYPIPNTGYWIYYTILDTII